MNNQSWIFLLSVSVSVNNIGCFCRKLKDVFDFRTFLFNYFYCWLVYLSIFYIVHIMLYTSYQSAFPLKAYVICICIIQMLFHRNAWIWWIIATVGFVNRRKLQQKHRSLLLLLLLSHRQHRSLKWHQNHRKVASLRTWNQLPLLLLLLHHWQFVVFLFIYSYAYSLLFHTVFCFFHFRICMCYYVFDGNCYGYAC